MARKRALAPGESPPPRARAKRGAKAVAAAGGVAGVDGAMSPMSPCAPDVIAPMSPAVPEAASIASPTPAAPTAAAKRAPRANKRATPAKLPVSAAVTVSETPPANASSPAALVSALNSALAPAAAKAPAGDTMALEVDSQASTIPGSDPVQQQEQQQQQQQPAGATEAEPTLAVQHKAKRAPVGELGKGAVIDRSRFEALVPEALANVRRDVTNRCFLYPPPVTGDIDCRFIGKTDDPTGQIKAQDSICYEWSYSNKVTGGDVAISISGKSLAHHRARDILYGKFPCQRATGDFDDASGESCFNVSLVGVY